MSDGRHKRRDVAHQDARGRGAGKARRGDEIAPAQRERLGAREPRIRRPRGECDGKERVEQAGPHRRHQRQRQDEARECEKHIGRAHQHRIQKSAGHAGKAADREPRRRHGEPDRRHHGQGHAAAEEDARENVAAKLVGAEEMMRAGRRKAEREILGIGIGRREHGRSERHEGEQQHDRHARQRGVVGGERAGRLAPALQPRGEVRGRRCVRGGAHRVLGSRRR